MGRCSKKTGIRLLINDLMKNILLDCRNCELRVMVSFTVLINMIVNQYFIVTDCS